MHRLGMPVSDDTILRILKRRNPAPTMGSRSSLERLPNVWCEVETIQPRRAASGYGCFRTRP